MTVEINGNMYITAADAAEHLATTQLRILMLIKQKLLCGEMIDGEWFVTMESLKSYIPGEQGAVERHECRSGCGGCQ